ncbi:MAG: sulfoxide reductase heme-binding subunit YedZ [Acidobacteria bacterium]|nr:MAG: sulfoxide reductase heme-binding subunit YedZ [Acidobacteria bacterium 13_2_20CM_58_27]PYT66759.1 MAG: sulfoxide reductase heme-binding subunit YedZ [Acidobacteriota bacterium]PYT90726.1 MAG: sulfoxide reductase heme-binding subunit YedZ [Acidobacteriota bacterium]
MRALLTNKWTKAAVFVVCLMPLGALVWRGFNHGLGANPVEFIQLAAGDWTLRFLVITLSVTPFRKLLNLPDLIRFRRMLGLFAFSYLSIHFLTYLLLDQSFDFAAISKDVAKRPFITVGFLGFLLLLPMAITSTAGWIRRLGGRRWQMIHRGIYLAAICGVIHYYWKVKSDVRMPLFYGALVAILLLWRLRDWFFKRRSMAGAKLSPQHAPANPPSRLIF